MDKQVCLDMYLFSFPLELRLIYAMDGCYESKYELLVLLYFQDISDDRIFALVYNSRGNVFECLLFALKLIF